MIMIHGPLSLLDANVYALYKAFEALGKAMILDFSGAKKAAQEGIDHLASWTERVYRFNQRMSGFGESIASVAEAAEQAIKKGAEGTTQVVETWGQKREKLFATLTDAHRQAAESMTSIERNALAIQVLEWQKAEDRKFEALKDMNVDIVVAEEQALQKRLQLENKYFDGIRKTQEKVVKAKEKQLEKLLKLEATAADKMVAIANKALTSRISIGARLVAFSEEITDELMKLTKSESEYNIWAEEEKFKKRKELLDKWLVELKRLKEIQPIEETETIQRLIEQIRTLQLETDKLYKTEKKPDHDPEDFAGGFMQGLQDVDKELNDKFNRWREMAKELASSMRDSLSDLFFDSMMGELESASDYWKAFTTSVKRMIADMTAQWLMMKAAMAGASIAGSLGFASGEQIGTGGSPAVTGAPHLGGLRRFHPGGQLETNEGLAILKRGEFVIRDTSTRNIGVDNLERMNRTGQMPEKKTVINHYHQYKIDAIDPESLDRVLHDFRPLFNYVT